MNKLKYKHKETDFEFQLRCVEGWRGLVSQGFDWMWLGDFTNACMAFRRQKITKAKK